MVHSQQQRLRGKGVRMHKMCTLKQNKGWGTNWKQAFACFREAARWERCNVQRQNEITASFLSSGVLNLSSAGTNLLFNLSTEFVMSLTVFFISKSSIWLHLFLFSNLLGLFHGVCFFLIVLTLVTSWTILSMLILSLLFSSSLIWGSWQYITAAYCVCWLAMVVYCFLFIPFFFFLQFFNVYLYLRERECAHVRKWWRGKETGRQNLK